jgi:uncharacterized protein (DUF1697 family)
MNTWIALFRGINVGGNNPLPMKDLREDLAGLGLEEVRTYIQSGNAVFRSEGAEGAEALAERIAAAVEARHGHRPRVLLLEAAELRGARDTNPYPGAEDDPKSVHLYFLASAPTAPDLATLEAARAPTEAFHLEGRIFYLHAPAGVGRSKLAAKAEKLLGVPATARNWRTVGKLCEMAEEAEG